MSYIKINEAAERLGFTEKELNTWSSELEKFGFVFSVNNQGVREYKEEDLYIFSECYRFFKINRIDSQIERLKSLYPTRFLKPSVAKIPDEFEVKRVNDLVDDKTVHKDLDEIPATKRQLFALHLASSRTVDTRKLKIDKKKAGELIGRSKNGEDITEILKSMLEKNEDKSSLKKEVKTKQTVAFGKQNIILLETELKELRNRVNELEKELVSYKKREKEFYHMLLKFFKSNK